MEHTFRNRVWLRRYDVIGGLECREVSFRNLSWFELMTR